MGINRLSKSILLTLLVSFAAIGLTGSAHAESINSYLTRVTIDKAGQASFEERIQYFFTSERHGIYREIPFVGALPDGRYLIYNLSGFSAQRNGSTEPFTSRREGSYDVYKIGDPNRTITGEQVYGLSYQLGPIVRQDEAGDYLSINLFGPRWTVSAENISGEIMLPAGVAPQSITCYTGPQGSREQSCTTEKMSTGLIAVKANGVLNAGEGMTVDIVVPSGSFDAVAYAVPTDKPPSGDGSVSLGAVITVLGFMLLFVGGVIGFFVYVVYQSIQKRKRQKAQTIVAEYEPPKGMLPGDIGLIADEQANAVEVTATIIDLARRGYLTIHYEKTKKFFVTSERFLLKSAGKATTQLTDFEETLLNAIFAGRTEVYVDDLDPRKMYKVVESIKTQLENRLKTMGLFAQKQKFMSPDNLTQDGYKTWAKVEGLKLYLNVAEKDRMKFAEAPDKTPERFTKLLPYAIALGVEKEWAKQFDGIDVSSATQGWYYGSSDVGRAVIMTQALSNSFATSVSSHFSPPSSSGGAGGGFSGGGAGGGGGGGW